MKKVLPYLGASLTALAITWATPSFSQEFKDIDSKHWAYEAVTELQQKGVITGYPEGYFRGKKLLTRYEFAIALKRALDKVGGPGQGTPGPAGPQGPAGEAGPAGPAGPAGMTPEEVENLKKLTAEFRSELTSLGANVRDINNRLDALAKSVADLTARIDKMPQFSGSFFVGTRNDRARSAYIDQSGSLRAAQESAISNPDVVHDFHLKIKANLPGDTKFTGDLVASNYIGYRGGLSGTNAANRTSGGAIAESVFPYQAQLDIPVGLGQNGVLTIGRYKNQMTGLTLQRPDFDAYFDTNEYDDGNYVGDGARLKAKFGSLGLTLFGQSYASATTNTAGGFNRPALGGTAAGAAFGTIGQAGLFNIGQNAASAGAGVHLALPVFKLGELGVSAAYYSTGSSVTAVNPFNSVTVYGANFKLNPFGRFKVNAEAAKSVTGSNTSGDGQDNEDNNAYKLNVGWGSGPLDLNAGYQYVDPRFAAPGFWTRLGSSINPTNIKGPYVNVKYKLSDNLGIYAGGDFLEGARNRTGFDISDKINRVTAGVSYKLSKTITLLGDFEGVYYDLNNAATSGTTQRPQEQYITIGTNLNLTSSASLKLAYQIINVNGIGSRYAGLGVGNPGDTTSNANVFTTQVQVHF